MPRLRQGVQRGGVAEAQYRGVGGSNSNLGSESRRCPYVNVGVWIGVGRGEAGREIWLLPGPFLLEKFPSDFCPSWIHSERLVNNSSTPMLQVSFKLQFLCCISGELFVVLFFKCQDSVCPHPLTGSPPKLTLLIF